MRVIVVLLFAAACGGSAKSAPPPAAPCPAAPEPPKVATEAELTELENRFCSCTDNACYADALDSLRDAVVPLERGIDLGEALSNCVVAGRGAIDELAELKTRACACHDRACAEAVQKEFDAFLEKHQNTKGSQRQAEHVGALAGEMSECLGNAMAQP